MTGEGVSQDDWEQMRRMTRLSAQEEMWMGREPFSPTVTPSAGLDAATGFGPMPVLPRPPAPAPQRTWWGGTRAAPPEGIGPPPMPNVPMAPFADAYGRAANRGAVQAGRAGQTARRPAPPPEEIEYLRTHPQIWQEFAKDYGLELTQQLLRTLPQP
jgi:hypothetical protein